MKTAPLAVLVVASSFPSVHAQELAWTRSPSGRWFGFSAQGKTWPEARSAALALGAQLATIRSAEESGWLRSLATSGGTIGGWIGLNDIAADGVFTWASGEPVTFTSWAGSAPNHVGPGGVTASFELSEARWYDVDPGLRISFLVHRDEIPASGWHWPRFVAQSGGTERSASGDLDRDGRDDLVVHTSYPYGSSVKYLRGRADGGLESPVSIPTSSLPGELVLADFDRDGWLDIAIGHGFFPNDPLLLVSVLFGDPALAFTRRTSFVPTGVAVSLATGDVDGDSDPDLLVGHSAYGANAPGITILHSDGAGGFVAGTTFPLAVTPARIAVGDLESDLDVDWVVAPGFVAFVNDGTGSNPVQVVTPSWDAPYDIALADFDLDGRLDLAYARGSTVTFLNVWPGDGAGGFSANQTPILSDPTGGTFEATIALVDFDGNGYVDPCMAVASSEPLQRIVAARNLGALQFTPMSYLAVAARPEGLTVGDFDGDGRRDLAATGERIAIHRRRVSDCNGNGVEDVVDVDAGTSSDFDGDGLPDECQEGGVPFCFGDGTGSACPCGNASAPGSAAGCLNSLGLAGSMRAHGIARVSADSVRLSASGMPNSTALYFQGSTLTGGGSGTVFGDGLLCAGPSFVRLATRMNASGASAFGHTIPGDPSVSQAGGVPPTGGVRHYQVWYRNAASFCTPGTFNLTSGVSVGWSS